MATERPVRTTRTAERGTYGSVRRVLLDGPDFQRLSAPTRWVFVALKISKGASGIDVSYREAVAAELAQKTGLEYEVVRAALDELVAAGWLRWDGNVLWLVGHLKHDPHLSSEDPKHRKGVQRHVAGLPRRAIVAQFIAEHPDWFPRAEADEHELTWAFEGPSKAMREVETGLQHPLRSTEYGVRSTEDGASRTETEGEREPPPSVDQSGPKSWQPIEERRLAERLPTSAGRNALSAVLRVAGSKSGVVAELEALLEGSRGAQHHCTVEQLDIALSDYVTNGLSTGRWNAQHFRACVRRAMQPIPPPAGGAETPGEDRVLKLARDMEAKRA